MLRAKLRFLGFFSEKDNVWILKQHDGLEMRSEGSSGEEFCQKKDKLSRLNHFQKSCQYQGIKPRSLPVPVSLSLQRSSGIVKSHRIIKITQDRYGSSRPPRRCWIQSSRSEQSQGWTHQMNPPSPPLPGGRSSAGAARTTLSPKGWDFCRDVMQRCRTSAEARSTKCCILITLLHRTQRL